MDFTDQRGFFDCVHGINKKYLKSADENIKFLEEYRGENGIVCIRLLKDAYEQLIKAIEPVDIVANKEKIYVYLRKYTNDLQKILAVTYFTLIAVRKGDLQENIPKDDAAKIEQEIEAGKAELVKILSEKRDKTDVLDSLIERSNALYNLVETWCTQYHLA